MSRLALAAALLLLASCETEVEVSREALPHPASGEWTYNASSTIQDNVVTADGRQYVVWVRDDRHPIIAARDAQGGEWSTFDLAGIPGNPLEAPTEENGHNFYSLGVDADGYLHLSGNHHAQRLRYIRSARPHTINRWTDEEMVGPNEGRVTYPKFFNLPDGTLAFLYRDGGSGEADTFLNRYDPDATRWERVHKLVDGASEGLSFYPNHVSTRDGSIHVMGVWRGSRGADTNRDVTYMRSEDGGESWVRADGSPQSIPLRHSNGDVALPTEPEGSGLLNGGGLEVDVDGRPHGAQLMYDDHGRTQVFHIWYDGQRWQYEPATRLTHRMELVDVGFVDNEVGHPSVATTSAGGTFILYRAHEHGQQLRAVDVTPGRERCEFTLAETRVDFWNPVFDTRALYDHDRLNILVVPTGHPHAMGDEELAEWSSVDATLVSVEGDDLEVLADHCRDLPPDERARTTPATRVDIVALTDELGVGLCRHDGTREVVAATGAQASTPQLERAISRLHP